MPLSCLVIFMGIAFAPSISGALEEGPRKIRTAPEVLPTEIRGTVRINGWTGDVAHAVIYATPVNFLSSADTRMSARGQRGRERIIPLKRTADPHVFSFSIRGLQSYTPYRLGITVPPNPAQPEQPIKVFWNGLPGGMATSGMPPVAIEGYVANTEIEIRDGDGNWVGADDLQFTDRGGAVRTLRWKSNIPGVVAGELQISLNPYPTKGVIDPCEEPEGGIVYRQQFSTQEEGWQTIGDVDFGRILMPRRTQPPADDRIALPVGQVYAGTGAVDDGVIEESSAVTPISEMDTKMLALGAPLYVRVVPVKEGGERACNLSEDGVHGWVILAKLPNGGLVAPEPQPEPEVSHLEVTTQTYTPPVINTWGDKYRKQGLVVYKFIKAHRLPPCRSIDYLTGKSGCPMLGPGAPDWLSYEYNKATQNWDKVHKHDALGQALIDAKNSWVAPNQIVTPKWPSGEPVLFVYWINPGSCDSWCSAWDFSSGFVTGLYNSVGGAVTWWAEAFASIKSGVASVVADVVKVLPVIGDACDAVVSCETLIETGMNYGLASMGLPPSLPNWEQLQQQGMDYLAGEITEQISSTTGLPPEVTSLAADQALDLAKGAAQRTLNAMTENRGKAFNGWGANWVLPFDGMEPALRTISVRKKYAGLPPIFNLPNNLYLRTAATGSFIDLLATSGSIEPFTANLYALEYVHVPDRFPYGLVINGYGPSLKIPVVLQPDYSSIPAPQCVVDPWPPYDVKCSAVQMLKPDNPWLPKSPSCFKINSTNSGYVQVDCKNYNTHIALYYRDYWIEKRLDDLQYSPCMQLSAIAHTFDALEMLKGHNPWYLFDPPFVTFAATPSKKAASWNGPFYAELPTCN